MASEVKDSTQSRDSEPRRETPEEADFLNDWCWNAFGRYTASGANDESARMVHQFTPTRYELAVLARHYLEELYSIAYFWAAYSQSGSWEVRFGPFAERRLDTVAGHLGEEEFKVAIQSVEKKWEGWEEEVAAELAKMIPCTRCGVSFQREVIYQEECSVCLEAGRPEADS